MPFILIALAQNGLGWGGMGDCNPSVLSDCARKQLTPSVMIHTKKKKSRRSPSISIVHTQHVCVYVCTCKRVMFIMKS